MSLFLFDLLGLVWAGSRKGGNFFSTFSQDDDDDNDACFLF